MRRRGAKDLWRRLAGAGELAARVEALEGRMAMHELVPRHAESILPVMAWIEQATLAERPLISVVLPTRNRAELLPRALASIEAQTYEHWEALVVDDASTDGTAALLAGLEDARVRPLRGPARGAGAARNVGLEAARGELAAYLDDDNTFHRGWLKSVAWAFEQRPDIDVLYGAFVVDDPKRMLQGSSGGLPALALNPFDPEAIVQRALTDMSTIAHRTGLAEARFDESLREMDDWDLLARLSVGTEPLVLPAIAACYTTDAQDRLSGGPTFEVDAERVRSKARAARGLA